LVRIREGGNQPKHTQEETGLISEERNAHRWVCKDDGYACVWMFVDVDEGGGVRVYVCVWSVNIFLFRVTNYKSQQKGIKVEGRLDY